jgi:serine/threonine protein kinase/Tfp pilus assembly protein PilF
MDGKRISHYRIIHKLGAGGMGEVYLAEDTKLGRKVALKLLGEEFTTNRDRLNRFEQEACAASALNHPNILTIHEVGLADGHNFIATEFVDGVTLRKRIGRESFQILEVLEIGMQVASALEEAHTAGIVHRDIKPENIMVRPNGYVKILDFGLAKLTEVPTGTDTEAPTRALVHTDAGTVMGTSHYMSPEQARGKKIDARTDIWSLGVVLYEMVAGRVAFEGETATDVLAAITKTEPPPLARYAQKVPAEFEWIVMKALRKDVGERYQTAKELHSDLKKLKQRLEFEAELERSVPPDRLSAVVSTAGNSEAASRAPTLSDQAGTAVTGRPTASDSAANTRVSSAEYIVTEIKRHKAASALIALVVVAAIALTTYFFKHRAVALNERDTILLADFVNTTGEPVFDGTLKQALAVQLGQSPFLNIFPDERVRETLRFMGRSPDDRITRDVAREICERQGLKAMLIGTISSLGSHYVITLEAINAHGGDAIAREQGEAESKEQVLTTLGKSASQLREKLGESLSSIKKFDAPIEQATTSSLEALKAFTQGNEQRQEGHQREAIPLYKRAIEIDPNFALAYARLAVIYNNLFETDLASEYSQKAYELRDRVSERERFYISEKYHSYVTGDREEATNVLKAWARTYPNDYIPHNNLGVNYSLVGQYDDALKESREAVRISPNNLTSQGNLVEGFIRLNRYDEARQVLEQTLGKDPERGVYHFYSYQLAFLRGDSATMKRNLDWFAGHPTETDFLDIQTGAAAYYGEWHKASELGRRSTELSTSQDRKENAGQNETYFALLAAFFGNCRQAKESTVRGLALSRARIGLANAGVVLALCNEPVQAQSLIDELQKRFPKDTPTTRVMLPLIRAAMETNRGNAGRAIELLQPASRFELGNIAGFWLTYIRGQAYLRQRAGKEAAAEFQKILDHRGVEPVSPLYPLAHLGLARAAAVSGDVAKSRKEYQDFFAVWKDADPDLPVLIEARKEYEVLK